HCGTASRVWNCPSHGRALRSGQEAGIGARCRRALPEVAESAAKCNPAAGRAASPEPSSDASGAGFKERDRAARMSFDPAAEIEFEKDHEYLRRMQLGVTDDLVNPHGCGPESFDDPGAVLVARRRRSRQIGR